MTCGVYKLTAPSGKCYIGSSINCESRYKGHKKLAFRGTHKNSKLISAFKKYGDLLFSILIICRPEDRIMHEQACLDAFDPEYNHSKIAGKVEFTQEVRRKLSIAGAGKIPHNKGKSASDETKRRLSDSHKGQIPTPETIAKIVAKNTGRKKTLETCRRISVGRKGKGLGKGKPWTEARRAKHAATIAKRKELKNVDQRED